nr:MAG TPA: hypothetical protein [Caudoviricetes sp.]
MHKNTSIICATFYQKLIDILLLICYTYIKIRKGNTAKHKK